MLKNLIKHQIIKLIYSHLSNYPCNFENLLASAVGVYLKKEAIAELDKKLNHFYQQTNIVSLKKKISYDKTITFLNNEVPKIDILTFKNPYKSSLLNFLNIWPRRLSLLQFCRIRVDLLLLNKNQQIPPHAHRGVLSGFILLEGEVSIRHYHASEYKDNGIICKKTIDRTLSIGDYTTNSDEKDNIHWLNGIAKKSILFRFNITGLDSRIPNYNNLNGRLYLDPSNIQSVEKFAPFLNTDKVKSLKF